MSQPTKGTTGRGGVISLSTDGGTTFTVINGAKNVSFSGPKSNFDDKTTLSSPGAVQEFQPTTIDPGTASLQVVWDQTDAGQLLLSAQFYLQTLVTVKVAYPAQTGLTTGPIKTFSAYVAEDGLPSMDISKTNEYSVQLRITGVITDTPGA